MSEYLERTLASKPTFGDYVTLEMKCYGVPNEHFIHEVLSSPFTSNSWREVPIKAGYFEEQLHDTSETVIAVRTQGINSRDAHIFAVRLADVLPMKGTNWSWRESPLRSRIAELEQDLSNKETEYTDLWDDALALQSRIAELEAYIDQLIEVGHKSVNFVEGFCNTYGNERPKYWHDWKTLEDDWKEREK